MQKKVVKSNRKIGKDYRRKVKANRIKKKYRKMLKAQRRKAS